MLAHIGHHGTQVLQVEQQKPLVIGNVEDDVEHALLHICELEQTPQQHGAHLGDGRAHGHALFAVDIPEAHGAGVEIVVLDAELGQARHDLFSTLAGNGHARDVAFDVSQKRGDAGIGKALRQRLERDRLAGARSAGDEAMAVGHVGIQEDGLVAHRDLQLAVNVHEGPPWSARVFIYARLYRITTDVRRTLAA